VAFLIGAAVLIVLEVDPLEGFGALLDGAFGSASALTRTALKATPLLLVGAGITVAFRAKVINVGGEGQMVLGALGTTVTALALGETSPWVSVPVSLVVGMAAGGLWGALPGALKAYAGVNEILSTIMLNIVAIQLMNFLLRGPLIDPVEVERGTRIPQTERLPEASDLPALFGTTRFHIGPLIAVVVAVATWAFLFRTTAGFRLRAAGAQPEAATYAGMNVKRSVVAALAISGALAGLAGAVAVLGSESHRLVTDGSTQGFTGNAGFNGIVAALFGGLHPLTTIPASFLFGGLLVGANTMQRAVQVPASLITVLNGLVVVFVVSTDRLRRRLATDFAREEASDGLARQAEPEAVP
jgi:simple sugar transport system permease protein